jgi:hypothetical protein
MVAICKTIITPLLPEGEKRDDAVATLIEIEYIS